jgi:hypothetical protein
LKAEAFLNTVARKEGRLHSQSTRKKGRWKNPDQITVTARKKANILQIDNHSSVIHVGDANQTTSTQTLLSPNPIALSPTIIIKFTFIPRQQATQLAHTKPCNVQQTIVYSQSRILQHQPLHRPYITPSKRKFGTQKVSKFQQNISYENCSAKA